MELSKYKACICEGGAERAIMDILLENDLLIFSKNELINDEIIFCRSAREFENRYLRHEYDNKISVIRILDSKNEKFKLSKAYIDKIDVINVITAPEIEMLIIHSENMYKEYCKSNQKPSDFCKQRLHKLRYDKKYDTVRSYFSSPKKLVYAIKIYHQKQKSNDQYSLLDLLKN